MFKSWKIYLTFFSPAQSITTLASLLKNHIRKLNTLKTNAGEPGEGTGREEEKSPQSPDSGR